MTTYNAAAVADSVIAFKKGITLQQGRALRDNPLAMFEGAAGAPRLLVGALQRPNAGNTIRCRSDGLVNTTSTTFEIKHAFGLLQAGNIRIYLEHRSTTAATSTAEVYRVRNGTATLISAWGMSTTAFIARTTDFSVIPGDTVVVGHYKTAAAASEIQNVRLQTNGEDYYPVPAVIPANSLTGWTSLASMTGIVPSMRVEGNTYL